MKRFLAWFVLEDGERIVRIKSLWPTVYRNPWGKWDVCWPCLLIDRKWGQHETVSPVWDRTRLSQLWRK